MPVVPRPQTMSVMPSVTSGGGFGNPLSLDAATLPGRQISHLGEAIQSGAHVAEVFARSEKDKAEATVALDGSNRLQQKRFDLADPDKVFPGVNDWSKTEQALAEFDKGWADISATMSPGARGMLDQSAMVTRSDLVRDLARNDADRARKFHADVLATTVNQATGVLMAGTGGNDASYAARARAALTADGLGRGLSGEDLDRYAASAFGRRVVEPVVTARLSQGDVIGARAFFDAHRNGMAADDAERLDTHLVDAGQAWDAKTAVDDLWMRLGPKSLNDPIDIEAMENDLVVRHGGNAQALMRERDEVLHRILGFIQARDETHAGYVNLAIARIKDGASPSQVASLPQFLALPLDQQQQLIDWQRGRVMKSLTGFAPDQNLERMAQQFAAYHDLSAGDALKQMSEARIQALEPVLGEDLTRQALAKKQAPSSFAATDFGAFVRSLGLDPDPQPSDRPGRAQLGVLRSAVDTAIASSGKVLTPQQQREVGLEAAQTAIAGNPLFQLPPEVQQILEVTPDQLRGGTRSAFSPEPWSPAPEEAIRPGQGRSSPPRPSAPQVQPSEDPVIRQAAEKARRLGQIAEGWNRAANLAKDAVKAGAKWVVRRSPVIGTIAGLAAPNEIGTEVSTYLFGRNASDTNLRLSGRSDDRMRVVQIRRQGMFGPTWETIARAEPDRRGHGSYRIVDRAAFAKNTGFDWDTVVLQSTGGKPEDKVGFGIAVSNDDERAILNDGIANRDSATNIQRRIDLAKQSGSETMLPAFERPPKKFGPNRSSKTAQLGQGTSKNYRATFFDAHPQLKGQVVVHHAIERQIMTLYPQLFTEAELHSLENLRGIPKEINSSLHLSALRKELNVFYKNHPNASRQDILSEADRLDKKYGHLFKPSVGER